MQFSAFGEKFTQHSGILQLMDDLGDALKSDKPVNMLGGGNPAAFPKSIGRSPTYFPSWRRNTPSRTSATTPIPKAMPR